jgi:PAS domain S-box-containing protein
MTERVERAQILSDVEYHSLFTGIIKLAREAIVVVDEQQNIVVFNEGAERIFRYNASEVIGRSLDVLLPPFLSEIHSDHVGEFARASESARDMNNRLEISGRRKDGSIFPAEASILKMRENGKMFFGAILQDITERKEAQRKIVESSNFTRAIFNSLSAEIVVVDAQGEIVSVNDAWREFADRNHAVEIVRSPIGLNYLDVCEKAALSGDESAKKALDGIRQVLSGAKNYFTMEYTCHSTDELHWFVMRVLPLKDQSGRIIITHQDVTPRKLSEQRLYETQRIAQIGSWELDLVSGHLYWSDEIYRIFEIDKEKFEASYQAFLSLVHPEDRDHVDYAYLRSVQMREPYETTHRLLMKDGRIKFLRERGETFYAPDGTPVRSMGMVQDITERKRAEEALLIKDRAMASSMSAIALANLEGQLTYVNEAFLIMWGYTEESEALGRPAVSFWESEEQARKVVQALVEKGNWIGEMRGKKRDGTFLDVLVSASMIREQNVQPVMMASFLDITERKRVEKELQDREKRLREIVDSAPFGAQIYELINDNLILLQANQAANEIFGMHKSLYVGKTLDEVFPALFRTDLPLRIKHVAMRGGKYSISQFEYRDTRTSGVFELHAIQTTPDQIAIFFRDITELAKAYDETLVGWSRALEFRDKETDGHTQRVTDLTVRLARKMGIAEEKIIYIRWGALLHDMGKIAVPDKILLKPDSLSKEEWEIMRKHPEFAYEMLYPITFLRPALDIPYCHHEKWDGSGYPRRLKGIEIPLAARIFAVVDVWDALRSDRPYRPKWSEERVIEYIRLSSDKHFDPAIVDNFLDLLKNESENNSPKFKF